MHGRIWICHHIRVYIRSSSFELWRNIFIFSTECQYSGGKEDFKRGWTTAHPAFTPPCTFKQHFDFTVVENASAEMPSFSLSTGCQLTWSFWNSWQIWFYINFFYRFMMILLLLSYWITGAYLGIWFLIRGNKMAWAEFYCYLFFRKSYSQHCQSHWKMGTLPHTLRTSYSA